jgi:hypothetical protein
VPTRLVRSHRTAVRGGQRRKLVWATTDQSLTVPTGQISNVNLLAALSVAGSSLLGITIMRTHLRVQIQTGGAATQLQRVGLIVGRVSDVGTNIAGQQDPSNPELDWMLLDRRQVLGQETNVSTQPCYTYDVRAKRKMQELNQAYILALSNNGVAGITFALWARVLIALP